MIRTPHLLTLSLAVTAALSGCGKPEHVTTPHTTQASASTAPKPLTLDTSQLPAVNQFKPSDLDTRLNACDDFNGYANAKFLAANPIPGDRTSWGTFEMLDERSNAVQHQLAEQAAADSKATGVEKIVGDLWATGMDEAKINTQGIAPIQPELAAIERINGQDALVDYLRRSAATGQLGLFGFGAEADFKQSDMNIAYAMQGGLGLPDPEYYTKTENQSKRDAYQAHIAKVLELSGVPAADTAAQAKQVVDFETRLATVSKTNTELSRDAKLAYHPVTLAQADQLTPNWSWSKFFESQGVAAPEKFSLAIPAFHQEVSRMIAETDLAAWRAYLRFHLVDSTSPFLSEPFVAENFAFYNQTLRGQKQIKPRWKRVLSTINHQVGEALGQLYVQAAFPAASKAKMETMTDHLRAALKVRIEQVDWMSPETKTKALDKWRSFTAKIGYPEKWRAWDGLNTNRDSYLGNVLAAQQFNYKWNLSKIGKPVDKTEWNMSPQTVNAYYNPLRNEIVFPAAILQPPFFDPGAPEAMNYGGIGAVIGHEMTHGYDDQGSRFGPDGNFIEDPGWWTRKDLAAFKARTGKLVAQFDSYRTASGDTVNGKLTLGENIADLGGLNTAYDAMKAATTDKEDPKTDGISRDQRFFLNWATVWRRNLTPEELSIRLKTDPHAPANFRAIGAPSNMPSFAAAFSCKPGDNMVRAGQDRVVIW